MIIKVIAYDPCNNYKITQKIYAISWWEASVYEDAFKKKGYDVEIQKYYGDAYIYDEDGNVIDDVKV